ncbi:bacterio-opsin activator domain-containing protein [Natronorarus salvus]|uniref:bacterio-opsin activator domain-containing protein n=1 Tax=Natronorarus salvus TaxID=3117733 RepID=UPI002F26DA0C
MPGDSDVRARGADRSDGDPTSEGSRTEGVCCDGGLDPPFADRTLDAAPIGILVTDPSLEDNPIVYANEGFRRLTGYGDEEVLGRNCRFLQGEGTDPEPVAEMRAAIEAAEPVTVELRNYRRNGSAFWNRVSITPLFDDDGDLAHFVGCQEDVTERVERERMLSGLHAAVPSLMLAGSVRAVGDLAVETVLAGSELSVATLYRFAEDSDALRPIAHATLPGVVAGTPSEITDPDDPIRLAFADGDSGGSLRLRLPGGDGEEDRSLAVPVGEHGVVVAGGEGAVRGADREFVELLASTVEAALDRLARETELERRNERLVALSRLNAVIRGVNRAVVGAETRAEVERAICEHLAETSPFRAALVASARDPRGGVRVREVAGIDAPTEGPVTDAARPWVRAVASAIRNGTVETLDPDEGKGGALAAVPLVAGEATYGVLVVFAAPTWAFDEEATTVLSELGETIGLSIRAVEARHSLLAETAVELALVVDEVDSVLAAASRRLDRRLSVEAFVPIGSGGVLCAVTADGGSSDAFTTTVAETEGWELLTESDERGVFVADAATASYVGLLLDHGVVPHSAVAEAGRLRLFAHAPPETELRSLLDELARVCPSVELAGRREVDRPVRTERPRREAFTGRLTDRQLSALRAAYHAGYFEWPRETTAEELAETMGISSSTLHFHLRRGLRKLLEEVTAPPEWRRSR